MSNRLSKYLAYAVGEILLVVIGILIALQVNNWNEDRKNNIKMDQLYEDLHTNLKTDSIALSNIVKKMKLSIDQQLFVINTSTSDILEQFSKEDIESLVRDIWDGALSFYPKMGVYNQMVNGNLLELIRSKEMKEALIQYYDFRCTRYAVADQVMDEIYHQGFQIYMAEELGMNKFDSAQSHASSQFTMEQIDGLRLECRKIYDLSVGIYMVMEGLQQNINLLLELLDTDS
jgi:hypothetical protein